MGTKKIKKPDKQSDQILALHIAGRQDQFERNGGGQWVSMNRPHKNKKKYDRNNFKRENRKNLPYFFLMIFMKKRLFYKEMRKFEYILVTTTDEGGGTTPAQSYTVSVQASPSAGGSVQVKSGTQTNSSSLTLNVGDTYSISTTGNSGYEFTNWTDNNGSRPYVSEEVTGLTVANRNVTWTANYSSSSTTEPDTPTPTGFTITLKDSPSGAAQYLKITYEDSESTNNVKTGTTEVSQYVLEGFKYTIDEVAKSGYKFLKWTKGDNDLDIGNGGSNIICDKAETYIAHYEEETSSTDWKLEINVQPNHFSPFVYLNLEVTNPENIFKRTYVKTSLKNYVAFKAEGTTLPEIFENVKIFFDIRILNILGEYLDILPSSITVTCDDGVSIGTTHSFDDVSYILSLGDVNITKSGEHVVNIRFDDSDQLDNIIFKFEFYFENTRDADYLDYFKWGNVEVKGSDYENGKEYFSKSVSPGDVNGGFEDNPYPASGFSVDIGEVDQEILGRIIKLDIIFDYTPISDANPGIYYVTLPGNNGYYEVGGQAGGETYSILKALYLVNAADNKFRISVQRTSFSNNNNDQNPHPYEDRLLNFSEGDLE